MVLSLHSSVKKGFKRLSGSPRKRPGRSSLGNSSIDQRDTKSNVKVVVRVRPQNEREEEAGQTSIIKVLDDNVLVFDPKEENNDFYFRGKKQRGRDLLKKPKKDLKLAFDRVFDGDATNEEVFNDTTHSVVDGLLNGYNCSVFAYGATGAGKTFTMLGNAENPGITFLTVMELYKRIESMKDDKTCDIAVSYLEVYNETIHDLLMPSQSLALREDPQRGVVVSGLTLHKPKHAQDLLSMLQFGNKNRTQHPTDANSESSRSHAVFIVYVKQQDRAAGLQANVRVAKMVLIDLAGSERATVTRNSGARMREGANINKSLLALGNCINSLADKKSKTQHVPYRDSKLTRLLKDSLGGNCQTVMIAAVSPSSLTYEDTYNTLRYADRAKNIRSHLKKNVMSVDMHVTKYAKIVDDLKSKIVELREELSRRPKEAVPCSSTSSEIAVELKPAPLSTPESIKLQSQMQKVFTDRKSILNEFLNFEVMDRHLDVRLSWRQTNVNRLALLSVDNLKVEKSTQKADYAIKQMKRKQNRIVIKKSEVRKRLTENTSQVREVEREIDSIDVVPVKNEFQQCQLEFELLGEKKKVQHLQQVVKMQDAEITRSETILEKALKLVRQQQLILSGHGYLTSDLREDFDDLYKQVEGCKEVVWADQECQKKQIASQIDISKLTNLPTDAISSTRASCPLFYNDDSGSQLVHKSPPNDAPISADTSSHCNLNEGAAEVLPPNDLPSCKIGRAPEEKTSFKKKATKRSLSIDSPILSAASKELLQSTRKPSAQCEDNFSDRAIPSSSKALPDDVFADEIQKSPEEESLIKKKAFNRNFSIKSPDLSAHSKEVLFKVDRLRLESTKKVNSSPDKEKADNCRLLIESPELSVHSREIIFGVEKLGLESTSKANPEFPRAMAVSANILFEPPTINDNVKKCLNDQSSNLKPSHNLNETFEKQLSPLDKTFEKLPESDLNTTKTFTSNSFDVVNRPTTRSSSSKLDITFSNNMKMPSAKTSANTTMAFKTPSRTPLSNSQNLSKSSLKSLGRSTDFKAKKFSKKLFRTQSISALKSENGENRSLRRFSSSRSIPTIPTAMTKTALLRTILNKGNSVSTLSSNSTLKKLMGEKKNSAAFR